MEILKDQLIVSPGKFGGTYIYTLNGRSSNYPGFEIIKKYLNQIPQGDLCTFLNATRGSNCPEVIKLRKRVEKRFPIAPGSNNFKNQ